ncbi:unnamed protein product [Natator depressus]
MTEPELQQCKQHSIDGKSLHFLTLSIPHSGTGQTRGQVKTAAKGNKGWQETAQALQQSRPKGASAGDCSATDASSCQQQSSGAWGEHDNDREELGPAQQHAHTTEWAGPSCPCSTQPVYH